MTLQVGNRVQIQVQLWNAKIIQELDNDMVYVTTSCGLGRDVHKNNIRESLFGNPLTEFPKGKEILVVRNYSIGKIESVFTDTCFVKFLEDPLGRDFYFHQLKKV